MSTFLLKNSETGMWDQLSWVLAYSTAATLLCMLEILVIFLMHKIQLNHVRIEMHNYEAV